MKTLPTKQKVITLTLSMTLFSLILLSNSCNKPSTSPDLEAERKSILSLNRQWFAAEDAKDLETTLSFMTPEVVLQPPNAPSIVGLPEVRKFYEDLYKLAIDSLGGASTMIIVAQSGDLAYDIGTNYLVLKDSLGNRVIDSGKYLAVWQKKEGKWKCSAISYSSNVNPANQ